MLTQVKQWLEPPQFEGDEEKTAQTRIANTLIVYLGSALLIVIFVLIPLFAIQKIGSWILSSTMLCGLAIGRRLLVKGNFRFGSVLIFSVIYLCILGMLILSGGSSNTAMFYFATVVLIAGFFLDARVVNWLTIATFLIAMGLSFLQEWGLVKIPRIFVFNSVFSWAATGIGLLFMIRTRDLFVGNLKSSLAMSRQQNTALQQVEASLRESEEKFKAQYKGIPIPTYSWKIVGDNLVLVDYNDSAFKFTYGRIVDLLGRTAGDIYCNDQETFNQLMECSRTKTGSKYERWHRLASTGERKYFSIHYAFVPPDLVMVHTEDITESRQMEDALHESEARFRALIEQSPLAISLSREGKGLYCNPKFLRLFGFKDIAEFEGCDIADYFAFQDQHHGDDAPGLSNPSYFEAVATRKDGSKFPVHVDITQAQLIDGAGNLAFVTDITESKRMEEEAALKNRHLTMLNHLGQVLNKLASLPEILERVSDLIGQVFDNRNLYIALYDEEKDLVSFPIYWMSGDRKNSPASRSFGNGLTEFVIRTRSPLLISDHLDEALVERGIDAIGAESQCYLGVPILIDKRVVGVIAVQNYEIPNVFNADHVELLSTIAFQAGIAIENARLYEAVRQELTERKYAEEALQQQNQFLIALQNTTLELVSQLDLNTLLENIVRRACALVGTSAGLLDLIDPVTNELVPQVGVGALEESLHLPVQPGEGLTGMIWQTGEMLVIPDYDQWAGRLDKFSHGTLGSVIGVPLLSGAHVLGVLVTGSPYGILHHFDSAAIEILNQFARLATVAVQNARLFTSLQAELTERTRAEQALQRNEARFRAVVQTAKDAIITMDAHGIIVDWNAAAETTFCYSAAEAIGMSISEITPEQFRARHRQGFEQALVSDNHQTAGRMIELAGLAKDGREFPIEMSLAEWRSQSENFFTAIIRNVTERKQRENELQGIAAVSAALRTAPTRAEMLPVVVEQLSKLLDCESMSVEIIDPLTGDAVVEAAYGIWNSIIGFRQPAGTGMNAILSETRQPYLDNHVKDNLRIGVPRYLFEGISAGAGAPLIAQDQLIGFLWMGHRKDIEQSEFRLLAAVADIAANAIYRATLHEQTQMDASHLARAYDTTLEGWAHALELRDQETEGHTRRVVKMTVDLARVLGIDEDELEHVRRGALLHDIGKMGIPDSVLLKPGTLNEREWEIMRRHPEYAKQFLEPIEYLHPALDIPYCHHEKWDGTGYPRGLKGEEIPLVARIFAIVDVWDALMSDRPYRTAWPQNKAMEYIKQQSGIHFDPAVVEAFLKIV